MWSGDLLLISCLEWKSEVVILYYNYNKVIIIIVIEIDIMNKLNIIYDNILFHCLLLLLTIIITIILSHIVSVVT